MVALVAKIDLSLVSRIIFERSSFEEMALFRISKRVVE